MVSKSLSFILAASLVVAPQVYAQSAPAGGAGAATQSAVGTINAGVVFASVAGVAVLAALTSGSSGAAAPTAAALAAHRPQPTAAAICIVGHGRGSTRRLFSL